MRYIYIYMNQKVPSFGGTNNAVNNSMSHSVSNDKFQLVPVAKKSTQNYTSMIIVFVLVVLCVIMIIHKLRRK